MANSLTDWLAAKVNSCLASYDLDSKKDDQTLLEDIAFVKGPKVQILHFYAPKLVQTAQQELQQVSNEQWERPQPSESNLETINVEPLWAEVGDKCSRVHVQFSRHCVARFNSTHDRGLISLRGAIISLRSFRPSISFIPSLLEKTQQKSGPFTPSSSVKPALFLEIEAFEVLGSINEVAFWQAKDLQMSLLSTETDAVPFKKWFKRMCKLIKDAHKRGARQDDNSHTANIESSNSESTKSSSAADSRLAPLSVSMPPPFQNPIPPLKRHRPDDTSQEASSASAPESRKARLKDKWDDFVLSQADDEFGLDLAASQMLERHGQGLDDAEAHLSADTYEELFSSYIPGTSAIDNQSLRQQDDDWSQISRGIFSQGDTLPATYPIPSSIGQVQEPPASVDVVASSICPPSVTDSTSLPFSISANQSASTSIEQLQLHTVTERVESTRPKRSSSRESSTQTETSRVDKRVGSETNEMIEPAREERGVVTGLDEATEKKLWSRYIRVPTAEQIKERDRTYASRVDLIID